MPLYDFKCNDCSNIQTEMMSIATMEDPSTERTCKECGGVTKKTFTTSNYELMSPEALGRHKAPGEFRNFLSAIKKAHPGSAIKDH